MGERDLHAHIRLCGALTVQVDGVDLEARLPGRQGRAVFAYLVVHAERSVSRDELADILWPSGPPETAGTTLKALISKLRRAIAPLAIEGRSELRLVLPEHARVDLHAARAELRLAEDEITAGRDEVALDHAERAEAGLRDRLLPSLEGDWVEDARRDAESLHLRALEVTATAALAVGHARLALAESSARSLIASDPFRESAHRLLIETLRARGDAAAAAQAYEALRRLLRDELGIAPSAETQRLHAELIEEQIALSHEPGPRRETPLPVRVSSLARGPYAGRLDELDRLERAVDDGDTGLVVLHGPPGIGKTRLAAELAVRASALGRAVLFGRCEPEPPLPYQPFSEALREALSRASADELARTVTRAGPELGLLVPELSRRIPGLTTEGSGGDLHVLFEAIAAALDAIAGAAGAVLVIDDLHHMDAQTARLLKNSVRRPGGRCKFVATLVPDDGDSPGAAALASLRRDGLCEDIAVGPLDAAELETLAVAWLGERGEHLGPRLARRSGGNPLFAAEILRTLADDPEADLEDAAVPAGVRGLVAQRLRGVSPPARRAARAASVLGREFRLDVLAAVLGVSVAALAPLLSELVAAGLVPEPVGDELRVAFSHDMVRDTIYDDQPSLERAALHEAAGTAIETIAASDAGAHAAELAAHFSRALVLGSADRAVRYGVLAGERAAAVLSFAEAAEHFGGALRIARDAGLSDLQQCEIELARAASLRQAGATMEGRQGFLAAAVLARRIGRPELLARVALSYGPGRRIGFVEQVDQPLIDLVEDALALIPEDDTRLRPRLMALLASELYYVATPEHRRELAEEAIRLARLGGDPKALAEALQVAAWATRGPDQHDSIRPAADELEGLARRMRTGEWLFTASYMQLFAALEAGEGRAFRDATRRCVALADNLRQPFYRWLAGSFSALDVLLDGDFDEAERRGQSALAAWPEGTAGPGAMFGGMQLFFGLWARGRVGEVHEATRMFADYYDWIPAWRCALTFLEAEIGEHESAARGLADLLAGDLAALPRDGNWLLGASLLTVAAVRVEDRACVERLDRMLAAHADQQIVAAGGALTLGSVALIVGMSASFLGDHERAVRLLDQAVAANRALGSPPLVAYTQTELAAALLGARRPDDARAQAAEAAAAAATLGMPVVQKRATTLGEQAGVRSGHLRA